MKKLLTLLILCITLTNNAFATRRYNNDSLMAVLDEIIDNKAKYEQQKRQSINRHLFRLSRSVNDKDKYHEYSMLLDRYKKFRLDSVYYYAQKKLEIAQKLGNTDSIALSMMNEADGLKGLGRFNEALSLLRSIPKTEYVKGSEYYYYLLNSIMLSLSATACTDTERAFYGVELRRCRDSIAAIIDNRGINAIINKAEVMKMDGKFKDAAELLENQQSDASYELDDNAIYWVTLAETYGALGNIDAQKYCLLRASIIDNTNCIKTYTSLQTLAMLLYREGDIDHAYKYIMRALEDITLSNARSRLVQVTEYMPIITAAYDIHQRKAHRRDTIYNVVLTLLMIVIVVGLIILYKRNGKLEATRKKLDGSNAELTALNIRLNSLNDNLNTMNTRLTDANKIKEEYITQLFNICSGYITDIEQYRISLARKYKAGQQAEIKKMLSEEITSLSVSELLHKFDTIFLSLFPSFIECFNELMSEEGKIYPKEGELLTPELRIYALVRLGINDSTKIAGFLHYSPQTVYNYRMRTRNKAIVPKEKFAQYVQSLNC